MSLDTLLWLCAALAMATWQSLSGQLFHSVRQRLVILLLWGWLLWSLQQNLSV